MDILQTIFKTIIFLLRILEICTKNQKLCKKHQKLMQSYDSVNQKLRKIMALY